MKSFIEKLKENNIEVLLKSNNLEIVSYKESISEELLEEIRINKDSIVQFLKNDSSDRIVEDIHYKASYSQIEIWAACQDSRSSAAYHLPTFNQIETPSDIEILRKALQFVAGKYEILRTNFTLSAAGDLIQVIHPESRIDVVRIDYRHTSQEEGIVFINQDNLIPFDLAKDPLLRCYLIDLPDNQSLFYYNIHHIISDEWSGKIFENEIFVVYDAFLNKREHELDNTNYRYRDYIDWHQAQLNETHHHKQYWKDILLPLPDMPQLPTSKPYPSFRTYNSISARMFLSEQETNLLNKLSQKLQGSSFAGILTVLKILIYKYTSNEDIIIGSFMAVRERAEFDRQIGYFLKTLILRNTVSETDSFSSLFGRIKKNLIPAYEHSIYPLSEILKDISFKRDQSRSSIFNIAVTFHEERKDPNFTQEIHTNIIEEVESTCKYDIELHFGVVNNQLYIRANYNTEIYEPHIINNFIRHYRELILKFSQAPDISISEIDYLVDGEREKLLKFFNDTEISYPEEKTLASLFEEQAEKNPGNTALVYEGTELDYAELNAVSNQLAHYLKDKYVVQGDDLICIKLPRTERMIISILGILKSGGAYVPIDIDYPQERIDFIREDTGAEVIIDESFFSDFEKTKENYSTANPDCGTKPENLAYIIYTSGTTGHPKGVMIENKSVINLIHAQSQQFRIDDKERVLQFSNYAFDASVEQIFLALLNGAALHLIPKARLIDNNSLAGFLKENKITHFHAVPSVVREVKPDHGFSLKRVIAGGDVCSRELAESWNSICRFYNEYGPTETTVTSIELLFDKESRFSIGKPLSNTQIYILDHTRQLVPVGVIGELYISGAGLARGYLNRPDLTEEKFVSNPFVAGAKMYRTGDLGRWLPDGNIEYLGRIDHQVKIRGHRVELGEIESNALSYRNAVTSAVAEVKEHEGDKNLVLYYVSNAPIDKQELSKYLETKLPQYMLPAFYVELESIPLTNNGKVDRKNLPEVSSKDLIKNEYVAPVTEQQRILVEVCEQVLKHKSISIKDNFYNLGGDSIKSIQIVSRLRQYGYSLKVMHILKYPVLEELSGRMTTDVAEIDQSLVTGHSVLTPIQKYFFENENIVNKNHYNQSVILKSKTRLSGSGLEQSLKKLVSHHDALRMVYSNVEGIWSQFNTNTSAKHYRFEYSDLRTSTSSEVEELENLQKIGEELQSSMDISSGILFHVGHVSMRDGDRLILILHHLVVDGVSWRILLEDLGHLYEAETKGQTYSLSSKTDSFQSWGKALEEYSKSPALSKERSYWEAIESGDYSVPKPDYLINHKQIPDQNAGFHLTSEETHLLKTRAGKKYGAEINDLLLTGLALSLREQFGISKTKVLMEGHGREAVSSNINISRTVGWFTSVYPFSLDISNTEQPALVSIKEELRRIPDKGIGYGILHYLDEKISSGSTPSVQFNYLGDFDDIATDDTGDSVSAFQYSSENIGAAVPEENLATDVLLDVSGMTVNGIMNISIRYSGKIFAESTIKKLTECYQQHLHALIAEDGEESVLTPSDLTYKGLSFTTLAEISKENEVEDIYELSPMQQGLYYHWLVNTKSSAYFMQTSYKIKSPNLDVLLIEKAFSRLINRYTILRTSFENRYGEVPLQVVHKHARVDFNQFILESELELANIKKTDIDRGFNLGEPTQMRLLVVKLPDDFYEFIWSNHHIIMDGWCLSILINDFTTILGSLQQGAQISLPDPEKYSSYIQWLANVDKEEALAYWANYLQGIESPTIIPFVKGDEELRSHYLTETLNVAEGRFEAIEAFCQDLGVTLNTYVQAVWSYLLSSYNGTEDVVFGSVVSGRPAEIRGIENMVGLFINTIPVHIKVNKEDTPRSLLEKVHQDSVQSTAYHFNSLAEIQSLSPLGKELINHVIVFENYAKNEKTDDKGNADAGSDPVLSSEAIDLFEQTNYPFTLMVNPENGCLHTEFHYDSSVFSPSSMRSMLCHFKTVVHHFVEASDIPLKTLDYVSSDEKAFLESFNSTEVDYPSNTTIISLFEDQAIRTPYSTALVYEDLGLSYAELNAKASSLALHLQNVHGIKKGDYLGVMLNRGENQIISLLGLLKLGAVYVPIDANLPEARKSVMTSDLSLLITESYYFFDLDFYSGNSFSIDLEFTEEDASDFRSEVVSKDDIAYIIYTSGSTGEPKGVLNTHGGILNTMLFQKEFFEVSLCENVAQFASFSFDASISEIFMTLLSGKSLHVLSDSVRKDAYAFEEYVNDHSIDLVTLPPAFFGLLNADKLQGLKGLITAGESAIIGKTKEYLKYGTFYNAYGPTETSICASVYKLEKESELESSVIPIGKPISNTQIYILDEYGNLVPVGVNGELYISGSGLAQGYLNRPDLTSEKFINNSFATGTKMYRTGDLARWLPDGNIEYLGRIDDQVKIRGHRIELGEIDSQVLSYSRTIKSVVTEVKEHEGDKSIVVYYVSDSLIDKQKLSQYLETQLPQYMLPGFYVELESIPLTNNGKVDRKNLPEVSSKDLIKNEYVAPVTEQQRILVEVCEQMLKHKSISIKDNFYNLGGDSIKSIQIVSRLRQYGYNLKVEHILQYPILEELSRRMTTDVVEIDQSVVTGESVLIPIQKYFFESEDIINKNHYNQSVILKSVERLRVSALEASVKHLVAHHDALRMVYSNVEGIWSQFNAGTSDKHYHFEYFDLRTSTLSEVEELENLQKIGEELQSSIDISSGILFHVGHVSMREGDRLILILHHLVVDGISWRILLEDLGNLYEAETKGQQYSLPSKTDSFQRWGKALEEYSTSSSLLNERLYWEGIESETYAPITTDYQVKDKYTLNQNVGFSLSKESTKLLQTHVGKKYGAEINDLLLTGLALSLREQFGISKTKILMEGHGREAVSSNINISRTVGWFTSVYPFSLDISNTEQPALVSIKEDLRSIPNKGIGYGILNFLDRSFNQISSASVQFNYLGDFNDIEGSGTESRGSLFEYGSENIGSSISSDNLFTDILLDISGMTVNGIMSINFRYSDHLFKPESIENFCALFEKNIKNILSENENKDWEYGDTMTVSPNQYYLLRNPYSSVGFNIKIDQFSGEDFEKRLRKSISAFPFLLTKYEKEGNYFIQRYLSTKEVAIKIQTENMQLKSEKEIEEIGRKMMLSPYDVLNGELIRVFVTKTEDKEICQASVFFGIHHSLADDYTARYLKQALEDYFSTGQDLVLQPHHFNFIASQESFLKSEEGLKIKDQQIREILKTLLYNNKVEGIDIIYHQDFTTQEFFITAGDFVSFKKISQETSLPFSAFCLSVFLKIINSYNDESRKFYGVISNNRENSEYEKVLGVLNNLIISSYPDFSTYSIPSILKNYGEMIEARTTQKIPYEVIRREIQEAENKDIESNMIGIYNYLNQSNETKEHAGFTEYEMASTDFKGLNFNAFEYANGVLLHLSHPSSQKKICFREYIQEFLNFIKTQ